jgi:hypothetical protein
LRNVNTAGKIRATVLSVSGVGRLKAMGDAVGGSRPTS